MMQRSDCVWLIGVVLAAVAFSIWGLPYFSQLGHPLLSLVVYAFFLVIFLYGRKNRFPRHANLSRRTKKKDPERA